MRQELRVNDAVSGELRLSLLERRPALETGEPPLVLVHGFLAEGSCFRHLMEKLPANRRIVALDLPGAGYSERPAVADASFAGLAATVRQVIVSLGLHRPILVGHSHGGAVCLTLAAAEPELLGGLVLLSPVHPFSAHEERLVRFYLSRPGRLLAHALPRAPFWMYGMAFMAMPGCRAHLTLEDVRPYWHTLRVPGTINYLLRLIGSWQEDKAKLQRLLTETPLQTPALLLWGELDLVVPVATAPGLLAHLEAAEQVTLPGVGHLPSEEVPAECASVIGSWLASVEMRLRQSA